MSVTFIVTSYNIAPYIRQCLESLVPCVRPGDQVLVVDDGSSDETAPQVRSLLQELPWGEGVEIEPIFLGHNTYGGVGIAANIGLSRATREAIFFVDGDDWLNPSGVHAARQAFEVGSYDILLGNYRIFDERTQTDGAPSDAGLWGRCEETTEPSACRDLALEMNAVPWRKFYRRAWLAKHELRFPEGDFFYEDNPFHWMCCLRAEKVGFLDVNLAWHRLNRPGQTMNNAGHGFDAMFTHYATILEVVKNAAPTLRFGPERWLATNMAWQLERISQSAMPVYAHKAEAVICGKRKAEWQALYHSELVSHPTCFLLGALLSGGAQALIQAWLPWSLNRRLDLHINETEARLARLEEQSAHSAPLLQETRDYVLRTFNQLEFAALQNKGASQ